MIIFLLQKNVQLFRGENNKIIFYYQTLIVCLKFIKTCSKKMIIKLRPACGFRCFSNSDFRYKIYVIPEVLYISII